MTWKWPAGGRETASLAISGNKDKSTVCRRNKEFAKLAKGRCQCLRAGTEVRRGSF